MMSSDKIFLLRNSISNVTQILSGRDIEVTQIGVEAYVDLAEDGSPKRVNLPFVPETASEEFCAAIGGFLDHEVAHILFTDFKVMKTSKSFGEQTYFMLNAIEDARVEKCMAEKFCGSKSNLESTGRFFLDECITPAFDELLAKDPKSAARALVVPMIRSMSGQDLFTEYMDGKWKHIAPIYEKIKDFEPAMRAATSTQDCVEIAKQIKMRLMEEDRPPEPEPESGDGSKKGPKSTKPDEKEKKSAEDASASAEGDGDEAGDGSEDGSDKPSDSDDGGDKAEGGDGESEEGDGESSSEGGEGDESASSMFGDLMKGASDFDEEVTKAMSRASLAAAKDSTYLPFTKDYDKVEILKVSKSFDQRRTTKMVDQVDHMVGPLQKDLERAIAARSLATRSHGHRAGRLHSANLARLAVNDDRVFSKKHETKSKDVAVELVIDASGSMNSNSRIDTAAYAAYALSSVLERIGIKNEVIAFTTGILPREVGQKMTSQKRKAGMDFTFSREEPLYMPIIKGFDERISSSVRDRFASLPRDVAMRNNVDGECVQIAAHRLSSRRESGKIMIVLSDGAPSANGDSYAQRDHLKKAVKEIEASGIKIVGIGIDSTAVKSFYSKSLVLNSVSDLPAAVINELRHLLIS